MSIFTSKSIEKYKKLIFNSSIILYLAVLYQFQFYKPFCKEVNNIVTNTSFSNSNNTTIPCIIPTLISPNKEYNNTKAEKPRLYLYIIQL